jgi:hypothetical protein
LKLDNLMGGIGMMPFKHSSFSSNPFKRASPSILRSVPP